MRTAVVILNWNTKEYLERFLPGLLASATDGAEIIVADSASTDGSMEMLSEKFPTVRQIRLDKNYGFTGGYNRAFKAVCELPDAGDLEYFVLINSDIEVPQDWLKPLTDWMDSHPDCAACAPKLHSWYEKTPLNMQERPAECWIVSAIRSAAEGFSRELRRTTASTILRPRSSGPQERA